MKKIVYIFLLLVLLACKRAPEDPHAHDTVSSGLIRIACDENFESLMDAEVAVFESLYPRATIIPIYTNEAEAIRLLTEDSVRFALVTRDVSTAEKAKLKERLLYADKHLVGFDGVAVIINKANQDSLIDLTTLKKVMSGELTEWSQINPHTPLGTIRVVVDNQSGILRYLADSIVGSTDLTPNIYGLNHPAEVVSKVEEMPNTLGLISVSALKSSSVVKVMRVNGTFPYAGNLQKDNYPLWRPVYVVLTDSKHTLPWGLSVFMTTEVGQKLVMQADLLPISDPQNLDVMIVNEYPE